MTVTKDLEVMLSNPKVAILSMAGPLFISYLIANLQTFVDAFWCSGLGPESMSAISLSAPIYWIIMDIGIGFGVGASTAIARAIGSNNKERADSLASQVIVMTLVISIVLSVGLFLIMRPMLMIMGGADVLDDCVAYALPMILGAFPIMMSGTITGMLRSEGAAKKSMQLSVLAAVLNMVIDPIMIYTLGLGVLGASITTIIAYSIAVTVGLWWYKNKKLYLHLSFRKIRFIKEQVKDICIVGIPHALELVLVAVLIIPQNVLVEAFGGNEGIVTYYYPYRFIMLATVPAMAMAASMIPVTSSAQGQNDFNKAKEGFRYAAKMSFLMGSALAVTVFVLAGQLTAIFCYSPDTAPLHGEMTKALMIYAMIVPASSIVLVCSGILQSLRLAQISTVIMIAREILLIVLFYFASAISMTVIYWSLTIGLVAGAFMMICFASYGIKKVEQKYAPAAQLQ